MALKAHKPFAILGRVRNFALEKKEQVIFSASKKKLAFPKEICYFAFHVAEVVELVDTLL